MRTKKRPARSFKAEAKTNSAPLQKSKGKPLGQAVAKKPQTKTSILIHLLSNPSGSTISELQAATGWQSHSVHGFMAGTLKKKGLSVGSEGKGAERRYRLIGSVAQP